MEQQMEWNIYLSGEIHTDWRDKIIAGCKAHNYPLIFPLRSLITKQAMQQVMV